MSSGMRHAPASCRGGSRGGGAAWAGLRPPALGAALLLAVGGPAILPAGLPSPPPPGRGATLRATIPGLGVGRSEELLAPLEQTAPLSRPTGPLTGAGLAASLEWAQGSCELPTAKPRVRSPLPSAPRRLL